MIALSVLDEDQIEKLDQGGIVAGMTLDDIDRMTNRELRENLREEKEKRKKEKQAQEEAIAKKEKKLNELEQKLRYQEPPTAEQLARAALLRFRDPIIDNILEATERMGRAIAAIDEAQKVPNVPYEALEELLNPWKESFNTFCDTAEDLTDAFNNIHVDKGRG
jgi:vacuolar-type H+-ATPase subunit E/Vma4